MKRNPFFFIQSKYMKNLNLQLKPMYISVNLFICIFIIFFSKITNSKNYQCKNIFNQGGEVGSLYSTYLILLEDLRTNDFELWKKIIKRIIKSSQPIDPFADLNLTVTGVMYKSAFNQIIVREQNDWSRIKAHLVKQEDKEKVRYELQNKSTVETKKFFKIKEIYKSKAFQNGTFDSSALLVNMEGNDFLFSLVKNGGDGKFEMVKFDTKSGKIVNNWPLPEKYQKIGFNFNINSVFKSENQDMWAVVQTNEISNVVSLLLVNLSNPLEMKGIFAPSTENKKYGDRFNYLKAININKKIYIIATGKRNSVYRFEPFSPNPSDTFKMISLPLESPWEVPAIYEYQNHFLLMTKKDQATYEIYPEDMVTKEFLNYPIIEVIPVGERLFFKSFVNNNRKVIEDHQLLPEVGKKNELINWFKQDDELYFMYRDEFYDEHGVLRYKTLIKKQDFDNFQIEFPSYFTPPLSFEYKNNNYIFQLGEKELIIINPIFGYRITSSSLNENIKHSRFKFINTKEGNLEILIWTNTGEIYKFTFTDD